MKSNIKITLNITADGDLKDSPTIQSESKIVEDFIIRLIKNKNISITHESIDREIRTIPRAGRIGVLKEIIGQEIDYVISIV